jgi:hypothetical protein
VLVVVVLVFETDPFEVEPKDDELSPPGLLHPVIVANTIPEKTRMDLF